MSSPTIDETGLPVYLSTAAEHHDQDDVGLDGEQQKPNEDVGQGEYGQSEKLKTDVESQEGKEDALDSDVEVPMSPEGLPIDPNQPVDKFAEPGRVRRFATVMNLVNSVLGAGILGIANSFKTCGVIPSIILIAVVAILTHYASVLVIRLQFRTKAAGYDDLCKIVLKKWGQLAFSISTILFLYCCMIAYLVVSVDSIVSWFAAGGKSITGMWNRALVCFLDSIVICVPLTIPRSLGFLSYFSMITVFCIFFFFLSMVIKACIILPKQGVTKDLSLGKGGMALFSSVSIYALTFCLPSVLLPIIGAYNKDIGKRGVVTFWAMSMSAVLVVVPGLCGYLIFGDKAQSNILLSFPNDDVLILIVRICFYLVVSFSYPAVAHSVMSSWSEIIYGVNNHAELPNAKRAIVLGLSNVVAIIIAMFLPNITPALSIGGSIGGALDSFFFPPFMWFMLSKQPKTSWKNLLFAFLTICGLVVTIICTYQAIMDAIAAFSK